MKLKNIDLHENEIQEIQKNIKHSNSKYFSLSKNPTTSHTTRNAAYKPQSCQIHSQLDGIISIDQEEMIAIVEPKITFKKLCKATLEFNLIPLVVPEFENITVGGAIMGAAIESSSFKYGQFNDTCIEYHFILGNGELIKASVQENSDLFYGVSGSYGTLGMLVLAKLKLKRASSHVLVHYERFDSSNQAFNRLTQNSKEDYLEGVAIDPKRFIIISGQATHKKLLNVPTYSQKYHSHQWFYPHLVKTSSSEELIPIMDYLFRYNRGAFWMGRYLLKTKLFFRALLRFRLQNIKQAISNAARQLEETSEPAFLFRWFLGWAFSSQNLYKLWHKIPKSISENLFLIQDFYIPQERVQEAFIDFTSSAALSPIWLCPIKSTATPQLFSPHYVKDSTLIPQFINLGFYGIPKNSQSIPKLTENLEKKVFEYGGRKMLYSHTYYSKETFSKIFDLEYYFFLRKKYHADSFIPLYQKIIS